MISRQILNLITSAYTPFFYRKPHSQAPGRRCTFSGPLLNPLQFPLSHIPGECWPSFSAHSQIGFSHFKFQTWSQSPEYPALSNGQSLNSSKTLCPLQLRPDANQKSAVAKKALFSLFFSSPSFPLHTAAVSLSGSRVGEVGLLG